MKCGLPRIRFLDLLSADDPNVEALDVRVDDRQVQHQGPVFPPQEVPVPGFGAAGFRRPAANAEIFLRQRDSNLCTDDERLHRDHEDKKHKNFEIEHFHLLDTFKMKPTSFDSSYSINFVDMKKSFLVCVG